MRFEDYLESEWTLGDVLNQLEKTRQNCQQLAQNSSEENTYSEREMLEANALWCEQMIKSLRACNGHQTKNVEKKDLARGIDST